MILSRYLSRDILQTTLAVCIVLLLIFLGGRFAGYLADASTGDLSPDVLMTLLFYRIPRILERVLPISLFLGILLVFGRLYVDNEISVLNASGVSLPQLLLASSGAIIFVALLVAALTFYVAPDSFQRTEQLLNQEKNRSELDLMKAGQFLPLRNSGGVIYSGSFAEDHSIMQDVFITRQAKNGNWVIMRSSTGHQQYVEATDERYLVLEDGYRYQLIPGNFVADRLQFSSLKQHLEPAAVQKARRFQYETLPTTTLLENSDSKSRAVLQWRISLLLLVPVVALIAVAMSRTTPRRGRYVKLLPAMLLYFAYMSSLDILRNRVAEGELSVVASYIIAHMPFVLIGVAFLYWENIVLWWRSR